jgi:hypothetical protein
MYDTSYTQLLWFKYRLIMVISVLLFTDSAGFSPAWPNCLKLTIIEANFSALLCLPITMESQRDAALPL